ncbi:MAG: alpha/beta hydrolase family protein [Burkholderiaceae bacterium]
MRQINSAWIALSAVILAAGISSNVTAASQESHSHGTTLVATVGANVFGQMLAAGNPALVQIAGAPKCTISVYSMQYRTVGGAGERTNASGAIMVPSGSDPACAGPRPVLLYAHGTTIDKAFNMANISGNPEATIVAAMYAAQGFIVVAPNYAGYDTSTLPYHPYLDANQQANDVIDSLQEAHRAFHQFGVNYSRKLVITGYSQGGHVAMAAQRALQFRHVDEFTVTALAGLSGPYAMSLMGDAIFGGSPDLGGTVFLPLITNSWQKAYGNLYSSPNDIYESLYATGIETLLPSTTPDTIFTLRKLPQLALFARDSLPQSPGFSIFFGPGNLIKTSYRNQYLADMVAHPCGTNPAAPLNCNPANPIRKATIRNDLRNYVPNVPVMLCGGGADPTVFFASTQATAGYFIARGMPAAALIVLDVDSTPTGTADPFAAAKIGFAQAKAATAAAAGTDPVAQAQAVMVAYHGSLVAPFCMASARAYFQNVLAH